MQSEFPFNHIAVFGLGLLGGSVCLAVRQKSPNTILSAYGRSIDRLLPALKQGMVDRVGSIDDCDVSDVDLVVIATTVQASIPIAKKILDTKNLKRGALVIDVGSVKEAIVDAIVSHKRGECFVGCHPMAGSEKKGYANSHADLYNSSCVIITPHKKNKNEDIQKIEMFWKVLGAKTVIMDAAQHDIIVAHTSHLPHMAACVLVDIIHHMQQQLGEKTIGYGIGKGFKDTTRIAAGSEDVWSEIVALNSNNIVTAIDKMIAGLEKLKHMITKAQEEPIPLINYLASVRKVREEIG